MRGQVPIISLPLILKKDVAFILGLLDRKKVILSARLKEIKNNKKTDNFHIQ